MAHTDEISLRIPSLRIKNEGTGVAETIANGDIRFSTQMNLDTVPKPGTMLDVSIDSSHTMACEVVRSDWHDQKNMFVVACRYAKRSITAAEYHALLNAPGWQSRPLL
jgi:hypothetical protein